MKLFLFDLDGTLLRNDKTLSPRTLEAIGKCREAGALIGISTSRAEQNCLAFLAELRPDLLIASGGAVAKFREDYIFSVEFSVEETREMIDAARAVCGQDCQISIDALDGQYWNYKEDPEKDDATWGKTTFEDFSDWRKKALKFCVQTEDPALDRLLEARFPHYDSQHFVGSNWFKLTKKEATKENAIVRACTLCGIDLQDVTAFGDDSPDIGMLRLCGTGIAMGNAGATVKAAADLVIGTNEEDGIAQYLEGLL